MRPVKHAPAIRTDASGPRTILLGLTEWSVRGPLWRDRESLQPSGLRHGPMVSHN